MSNDAVTELTKNPHTLGKIKALRQVVASIEERQNELPEKISYNDGARMGCAKSVQVVQDYITLMIKNDQKANIDPAITKQKRDLILDVKQNIEKVGQEFLQEHLMLKGEARALTNELMGISKLHKAVLVEERTKETAQSQQDAIREAQGRGEESQLKEKNKPKKTRKTRTVKETGKKPKKTRKIVKE
jgi:hypothetical protein